VFAVAGRVYRTSRPYDAKRPLRLLVEWDRQRQIVTSAYDQETGEQVYTAEAMTRIYLDAVVEDGALVGDPEPSRSFARIPSVFWEGAELKQAKTLVLADVPTRTHHYMVEFSVAGESYVLGAQAVLPKNLRLLVTVDPREKRPLAAYDMETGRQLYPSADLIDIYLDPILEKGHVIGSPKPFRFYQTVPASFWEEPEVLKASAVVLENVATQTRKSGRTFVEFSVAGRVYSVLKDTESARQTRLRVVVDPKTKQSIATYDMASGKLLSVPEDWTRIYLDPVMEKGRIVGDPIPFKTFGNVPPSLWESEEVAASRSVVMTNIGTFATGDGQAAFSVARKAYSTTRRADPGRPFQLLVVFDPATRKPLFAHDQSTGEMVYSVSDLIRIYLDPPMESGHIVGDPDLFREAKNIPPGFWNEPDARKAARVVLSNVPTSASGKMTNFFVAAKRYSTGRPFDSNHPMKLLVVADPRTKRVLSAYDQVTGESVYEATALIRVYLNPRIEGGGLVGDPPVFSAMKHIKPTLWKNPRVQQAGTIAFDNIPARKHMTGPKAVFNLAGFYITDRDFDPQKPLWLLVLADPKDRIPTAAFDQETGEQVYPQSDLMRVYLNPQVMDGRLAGKQEPVMTTARINRFLWEKADIQAVSTVAIANVPTHRNSYGVSVFSFGVPAQFITSRRFDPKHSLKLLVVAEVASKSPLAAYDMATGEQVYPVKRQPADQRLGVLTDLAEEGTQAGAEEPVGRAVRRWEAEGGVNAVVLSSSLLNQPYAEGLKAALRNLPPDLAERVYLAGNWKGLKEANRHLNVIPNGSADDVAVAVGQQVPAPEKVWLVGEFAPVYGWMLKQMGLDPEEVTAGADLEEFLSQLGILLGVPEEQVQSGVEELHRAEEAVEGQA